MGTNTGGAVGHDLRCDHTMVVYIRHIVRPSPALGSIMDIVRSSPYVPDGCIVIVAHPSSQGRGGYGFADARIPTEDADTEF